MGVPGFFRWISQKYPRIVSRVIEDNDVKTEDGMVYPADPNRPNPNGVEFDNLYLDMNGIVHPCCHPEDKEAPATEEEMMIEIFKYLDRILNMIRPRKLLYLAIDGVAPRAKMNQQRSRRFRAGQESRIKKQEIEKHLSKLQPQEREEALANKKAHFDSNCITPGTPFMDKLSISLKYYITKNLNSNPCWKNLNVILSDASVPGEGEHKVMDYIRKARNSVGYDPNTYHVLYGLDADLIMLSLATHEPRFKVLREDVNFRTGNKKNCSICNKFGHNAQNCKDQLPGQPEVKKDINEKLKPFVFLHVDTLREYLELELLVRELPFKYSFENSIDDWIFLIFFVGNDFLPHLPCLNIFDGAIERLVEMWKKSLRQMGGYITNNGDVNLIRAQVIISQIASMEDRLLTDVMNSNNKKNKRAETVDALRKKQEEEIKKQQEANENEMNKSAAQLLKNQLTNDVEKASGKKRELSPDASPNNDPNNSSNNRGKGNKRSPSPIPKKQIKLDLPEEEEEEEGDGEVLGTEEELIKSIDEEIVINDVKIQPPKDASEVIMQSDLVFGKDDEIKLGQPGYQDRYYFQKFGSEGNDPDFRIKVGSAYIEGLCWVLKYYFQGCPSWKWFYPYHYPPFAYDMAQVKETKYNFELSAPLKPFEQLMGVLPADSKQHLPEPYHDLMENPNSPIIDFYPKEFRLDLNGEKKLWKAIALLPFIEVDRLLNAMKSVERHLTPDEVRRNSRGHELLYISRFNHLNSELKVLYDRKEITRKLVIPYALSQGVPGKVSYNPNCKPDMVYESPLSNYGQNDVYGDTSLSFLYILPKFPDGFSFPCILLNGVQPIPKVLSQYEKNKIIKGDNITKRDYQKRAYQNNDYQRHEYYNNQEDGYRNFKQQTSNFSADAQYQRGGYGQNQRGGYSQNQRGSYYQNQRGGYSYGQRGTYGQSQRGGYSTRGGYQQAQRGGYTQGQSRDGAAYNTRPVANVQYGNQNRNYSHPSISNVQATSEYVNYHYADESQLQGASGYANYSYDANQANYSHDQQRPSFEQYQQGGYSYSYQADARYQNDSQQQSYNPSNYRQYGNNSARPNYSRGGYRGN